MTCLYHSKDLDGYTSGAVVLNKYPKCRMIGWDYGEVIPFNELREGEEIIMIDISFPMDEMIKISEFSGGKLTWIDHHNHALIEYNDCKDIRKNEIKYIYEDGIAACLIGWKYFNPQLEIPTAVDLISRYDVFDKTSIPYWDDYILPYQFFARINYNTPHEFDQTWLNDESTFHDNFNNYIEIGKNIIKYQEIQDKKASKHSFEAIIEGKKALCINQYLFSPDTLSSIYKDNIEKYDVLVGIMYTGNKWIYSLRSTGVVDVSLIAKTYGGGGHKMASGFESLELIFTKE